MPGIDSDNLHRTVKLQMDEGRAASPEEAQSMAESYVLQIEAGAGLRDSITRQAALLTAVNAGRRAFLGGVRVRVREDAPMSAGWAAGQSAAAAVRSFGGTIADSLDERYPTLVVGNEPAPPPGSITARLTWDGWRGGLARLPDERLPEAAEFPLSGVLAAALGVSEAFQHVHYGFADAGLRPSGLSLWLPGADWRSAEAQGPPCLYLPSRLWLVGLGHLGQAYAWTLGLLPFEETSDVTLMLQDYDTVTQANTSTGMLTDDAAVARKKTRVVAERLERLGFRTSITERVFGENTMRLPSEPGLALAGVDQRATRRFLGNAGFGSVIDAALGGRKDNYLDMTIRSFPSSMSTGAAWPELPPENAEELAGQPAYRDIERRLAAEAGIGEDVRCGVVAVAGRAVAAAFVGCAAAAFVLSEAMRALHAGPSYEALDFSLRTPDRVRAVRNELAAAPHQGFTRSQT